MNEKINDMMDKSANALVLVVGGGIYACIHGLIDFRGKTMGFI
jgi:hypothetical protein